MAGEVVSGSLSVEDGRIQSFDHGESSLASAVDLEGDLLMPGFIEIHTDNFERHLVPRPKVNWPSLPALLAHDAEVAAAGITTVFDALGVGDIEHDSLRGTNMDSVVQAIDDCSERNILRADHYFHVRAEVPAPNAVELFHAFEQHPRLKLISVMDHTPGQRQWENIDVARVYYTGKKGWSLEKFQRQVEHSNSIRAQYAVPHREYFVAYCREHGVPLASHDDTTIEHVQQAHAEGAAISEFPTTVLAARAARELGLSTVMGGPNVVRGGSHSGNVAAAELAGHGLLDMLSSDYVPGSLLTAVMKLVDLELMDLPTATSLVTSRPAQACGLNDRGLLEAGRRADLIQVRRVELSDGSHHGVVRAVWRQGVRVL
jgi:alpha-D-ribose 1-methylphosphonate 5-triphosphate diphosphatase